MTISEHNTILFVEIDKLSEELLTEQEKIIARLKEKKFNPKQFFGVSQLNHIDKQLEEMRNEWER